MSNIPVPGQLYRHFKGQLYRIVTLAKHSETGERMVVYQALYGDYEVYVRPLSMFMEKVDRNKYPNTVQEYRFELQKELIGAPVHGSAHTGYFEEQAENAADINVHPENRFLAEAAEERFGVKKVTEESEAELRPEAEKASEMEKASETAKTLEVETASEAENISEIGKTWETEEDVNRPEETAADDSMEQEELNIDPLVLDFLDAGTYRERLNILSALHHRITDEMITTMAIASDLEVGDGDVEERYEELRSCLLTYEKYEGRRMR